jgi:DNA-binding transcriptional LysR family regulator
VGVALVDRRKRPMEPTAEGEVLLRRVDDSLGLLRKGVAEIWSNDPGALFRTLKIALVEDLDSEVTPALAARLSRDLKSCNLSFLSRPSHDILTLLQSEEIDIGIASAAEFRGMRLIETPLLRDPYVLIAPSERSDAAGTYLGGAVDLPFLRYSKKQLMGRRIEAQLRRLRLDVPSHLELESTPPILSLVADGKAWTITTALNFACTDRYHDRITAMPFPDAGFVRQLSVFRSEEFPEKLFELFDRTVRRLVQTRIIAPTVARVSWLDGEFHLLES